jgi:hypothetical protein
MTATSTQAPQTDTCYKQHDTRAFSPPTLPRQSARTIVRQGLWPGKGGTDRTGGSHAEPRLQNLVKYIGDCDSQALFFWARFIFRGFTIPIPPASV